MSSRPENAFAEYLRRARLARVEKDANFSLRRVADRVGIEPSYLSKIERAEQPPPGENVIRRLAVELGEDEDVFLALAGKVSTDLLAIIRARPQLFRATPAPVKTTARRRRAAPLPRGA